MAPETPSPIPSAEPVSVETTTRYIAGRHCDDGYEFMEAAASDGWRPVPSWGLDGWDLGDWPYLVFVFRDRRVCQNCGGKGGLCPSAPPPHDGLAAGHSYIDRFERASYCEGDIRIETFASAADRSHSTDAEALAQWRREAADWVAGVTDDAVPAKLRGPFTWPRLNAAKATA